MNFNSLEFLIFLPIVVTLHWLLPHKCRWALLLAASLYFYMRWNVYLVGLLAVTVLTAYFGGILTPLLKKDWQKKCILIVTLVVCLGILIFFKYANFIAESVVLVINGLGANCKFSALNLILPIGISFYTFQTLSYVIDVYRGTITPEKHLGHFALYVCFFPQLVAGPIERSGDLLPQLRKERRLNSEDINEGLKWLLSGFIRKCVIADSVGVWVNNVYFNLGAANSLAIFLASALFMVQIYNDFAGYSEIALGSARLLGVRLSKNFNMPLVSASVSEFFRRWHITLNRWFTDYLYIPLGGNRKGMARKIFNTLLVFTLCGLWHGANYTYLLWGAVAGVFVSMESLLKKPYRALCEKMPFLRTSFAMAVRRAIFLSFFAFSCVLFRSTSISDIVIAYQGLFGRIQLSEAGIASSFLSLGIQGTDFLFLLSLLATMAALPLLTEQKKNNVNQNDLPLQVVDRAALDDLVVYTLGILAVAICWFSLLATTGTSDFSYFQF